MATQAEKYTGPMRFAHRGVAQEAPENTIGAFRAVTDRKYEGIEIDIRRSADGEIIVAHDSNFTRMTLGHPTGFRNDRISELTWEQIESIQLPFANHLLPVDLPPYSEVESMATVPPLVMGQCDGLDYQTALAKDKRMAHLMRFRDFDAWLAGQPCKPTVEIEVKAPGMMKRMRQLLVDSENITSYILFSGVPEYIREIQEEFSDMKKPEGLRLGANIRRLTEENKKHVDAMDLYEVGLNAEEFSEKDIEWLHDRDIQILSNLGDYPAWWEKLCTLDILGFKTNYPEAYTKWWMKTKGGCRETPEK